MGNPVLIRENIDNNSANPSINDIRPFTSLGKLSRTFPAIATVIKFYNPMHPKFEMGKTQQIQIYGHPSFGKFSMNLLFVHLQLQYFQINSNGENLLSISNR